MLTIADLKQCIGSGDLMNWLAKGFMLFVIKICIFNSLRKIQFTSTHISWYMKLKSIYIILISYFLIGLMTSYAQSIEPYYDGTNRVWGYKQGGSKIVIKPIYRNVKGFNGFVYCVQGKDNKWTLLNDKLEKVTDQYFDYAEPLGNTDLVIVAKKENRGVSGRGNRKRIKEIVLIWGLINSKGKLITEMKYQMNQDGWCKPRNQYMAPQMVNQDLKPFDYCGNWNGKELIRVQNASTQKWGFINLKGKEVIPCEYDVADDFNVPVSPTVAQIMEAIRVQKGGKWYILNRKGKVINESNYEELLSVDRNACFIIKKNGVYGLINAYGETKLPLKYEELVFTEGYYSFKLKGKYGLISKNGKVELEAKYEKPIVYLPDGFSRIRLNSRTGLVNSHFKEVVPCKYDNIVDFDVKKGLFKVNLGSHYGLIDAKGNIIWKMQYGASMNKIASSNLVVVYKNQMYGIIDMEEKVILPFEYDEIDLFSNGMAEVKKGSKYGFVNEQGKLAIPVNYDFANWFYSELAAVKKNGKWGFIDLTGKIVIPLEYDKAGNFYDDAPVAWIYRNGKYAVIKRDGNLVTDFIYESIDRYNPSTGKMRVKRDGSYFKLDQTGKESR